MTVWNFRTQKTLKARVQFPIYSPHKNDKLDGVALEREHYLKYPSTFRLFFIDFQALKYRVVGLLHFLKIIHRKDYNSGLH